MNDSWAWWLFFVGLGLGVAVYWLMAGRVRRTDDDLAAGEQVAEAEWIGRSLAQGEREIPVSLVAQVLELHRRYLEGAEPAFGSVSGTDETPVERDRAGREMPEPHVHQPG